VCLLGIGFGVVFQLGCLQYSKMFLVGPGVTRLYVLHITDGRSIAVLENCGAKAMDGTKHGFA
jgi:hypothetical protein